MFSKSLMDHNIAANDQQWFASLSSTDLNAHLKKRATLHLSALPTDATLTINARAFPTALTTIHALAPSHLHLLTLSTRNPSAPLAIFFRATSRTPVSIIYDHSTVSLNFTPSAPSAISSIHSAARPTLGHRGVAALAAPAERQWRQLTCHITNSTLSTACIKPGVAISRADLADSNDNSPSFAPLPRLTANHGMSQTELTAYHLDRTNFVRALVFRRFEGSFDALLGELQLAFLCFVHLGCLQALEHWTRLLRDTCNCHQLENEFPGCMSQIANMLNAQFAHLDEEAVQLALGSQLRRSLASFISAGWKHPEVLEFTVTLNQIMGWTLSGAETEGDDSDGPVVVEDGNL